MKYLSLSGIDILSGVRYLLSVIIAYLMGVIYCAYKA